MLFFMAITTPYFMFLSAINNISSFYDDSAVFFHNKIYTWYNFCFNVSEMVKNIVIYKL